MKIGGQEVQSGHEDGRTGRLKRSNLMLKNAGLTNSIGEFLLNSWTGFIGDGFINQVLSFLYFLKILDFVLILFTVAGLMGKFQKMLLTLTN